MTFARILGITVATAVIVFLGLTFLAPKHHEEKAQATGVTPDQVFGGSATPPAPGETAAAEPAPTPNPAAPAASAPAAPAPAETASAAPTSDTAAPAPAAADSSAPAANAAPQGLSDEEARKIAEDVGRKVATRVVDEKAAASSAPAESAPASAPAPSESAPAPSAPEPAPAASAPEPTSTASSDTSSSSPSSGSSGMTESDVRRIAAEEARRVFAQQGGSSSHHSKKASSKPAAEETASVAPAAAPATDSTAAPDTAAPAPAPAPATEEKPVSKSSKSKKAKKSSTKDMAGGLPATDAITAWWLTTDKQAPDHLNLVYAGSAATEKSAVLLFSDPVDAAAASSHLQLFSSDGKPVSGSWEASPSNPRMLLFKNLTSGRYTVVIAPEITSSAGKSITSGLHGPIYIR